VAPAPITRIRIVVPLPLVFVNASAAGIAGYKSLYEEITLPGCLLRTRRRGVDCSPVHQPRVDQKGLGSMKPLSLIIAFLPLIAFSPLSRVPPHGSIAVLGLPVGKNDDRWLAAAAR